MLRTIAFTTSFWNSKEEYDSKSGGEFGLRNWRYNCRRLFDPVQTVIASGSWSNPDHENYAKVVNAGITSKLPYCTVWWHLAGCAWTAGLAHCLDRNDWDIICALDTDCLIGLSPAEMDALHQEFWERPELLLSPSWFGSIGGPYLCLKREAAIRLVHCNTIPNLILERSKATLPEDLCIEWRWGRLFEGAWWNPWPQFETMRMDYPVPCGHLFEQAMNWPFVRQPHPGFIKPFLAKHGPGILPANQNAA